VRDILVEGLRMLSSSKNIIIPANQWGKLKTILQFIGLIVLFIFFPLPAASGQFDWTSMMNIALIPIYLALVASIFSGVIYYKDGWGNVVKR
jgi:CDP-diacylglycerol--glycerol-3-phosphate 3-phosphatidyltransferase